MAATFALMCHAVRVAPVFDSREPFSSEGSYAFAFSSNARKSNRASESRAVYLAEVNVTFCMQLAGEIAELCNFSNCCLLGTMTSLVDSRRDRVCVCLWRGVILTRRIIQTLLHMLQLYSTA